MAASSPAVLKLQQAFNHYAVPLRRLPLVENGLWDSAMHMAFQEAIDFAADNFSECDDHTGAQASVEGPISVAKCLQQIAARAGPRLSDSDLHELEHAWDTHMAEAWGEEPRVVESTLQFPDPHIGTTALIGALAFAVSVGVAAYATAR